MTKWISVEECLPVTNKVYADPEDNLIHKCYESKPVLVFGKLAKSHPNYVDEEMIAIAQRVEYVEVDTEGETEKTKVDWQLVPCYDYITEQFVPVYWMPLPDFPETE